MFSTSRFIRCACITTVLMCPTVSSQAFTCENIPSCAELGYSQNIPLACTDVIKCPFDISYKKCLNCDLTLTCADGGYEEAPISGYNCTVKPFERLTCYDCKPPCPTTSSTCHIGDVYYADGTCGSANDYRDDCKTAIGVVYMLSNSRYGVPVTDTSATHGRVIALHDLTLSPTTYRFDPANPFGNSYIYSFWGVSGITTGAIVYGKKETSDKYALATALKNSTPSVYTTGMENTKKIVNAFTGSCSYSAGTINYARYCYPTAAGSAYAFYPPNVSPTDANVGAGNWYLPTMGELAWLYGLDPSSVTMETDGKSGATGTNVALVNTALATLAAKGEPTAKALTQGYYWASNEANATDSWFCSAAHGWRAYTYRDSTGMERYTRPSLAF